MLSKRGTSVRRWRYSWLLAPSVVGACLLNPQGEDPSGDGASAPPPSGTGATSAADAGPGTSGSGGSAAGGTPGMGGSTASGGTGAATGVGGTASEFACPPEGAPPPPNAGLMPDDGNIDDLADTGILGVWYTLACDGAAVAPAPGATVEAAEGQICFSGTVPAAPADDPAACWGATLGFDLCAAPEDPSALPAPQSDWDPGSLHTAAECDVAVNGVSFVVTGEVPPELRVVFQEAGREAGLYASVADTGSVCECVTEIAVPVDAGAEAINADNLESVHLQVVPSETDAITFDFCISSLSVW